MLDADVIAFDSHKRHNVERLDAVVQSGRSISVILDIGSGNGYWCSEIARCWKPKKTVICVENDYLKLKLLTQKFRDCQHQIISILANANNTLPIVSRSTDMIILSYIGRYIRFDKLLNNCEKVLKPNGFILLVEWKTILEKIKFQTDEYDYEIVQTLFETERTIGLQLAKI